MVKEFSGWLRMKKLFEDNGILPLWYKRYDNMHEADIMADILRREDSYLRMPPEELTPMEKKFIEVVGAWE